MGASAQTTAESRKERDAQESRKRRGVRYLQPAGVYGTLDVAPTDSRIESRIESRTALASKPLCAAPRLSPIDASLACAPRCGCVVEADGIIDASSMEPPAMLRACVSLERAGLRVEGMRSGRGEVEGRG